MKWKPNGNFVWNIINEETINMLCLWKKYADEKKRRKFMLNEFLKGKKMVVDIRDNDRVGLRESNFRLVRCSFTQDIRDENGKSFKFKFKKNGIEENRFESVVELYIISKKVLKNWKIKRKKPSDDNFKFSNEKIKLWKQIEEKIRKRLKQEKGKAFVEKIIEAKKVNSRIDSEERKCRTLIKNIDQQLTLIGQKIDMVEKDFGAVFTEGERKDSSYSFNTTEDKGVSHAGLGYNTLITSNNQKVQGEGIC
jgi:hypothetical protein